MVRLRACGFIIIVGEQRGRSSGTGPFEECNPLMFGLSLGGPAKAFPCIFETFVDRRHGGFSHARDTVSLPSSATMMIHRGNESAFRFPDFRTLAGSGTVNLADYEFARSIMTEDKRYDTQSGRCYRPLDGPF
jgi:hypothetical protein